MRRRVAGQGLVEYGLILGGSTLVTFVTIVVLGPVLAEVIRLITDFIDGITGSPY